MRPSRIVIASVIATLLLIVAAAAIVVWSGIYNVAADSPHTAVIGNLIAYAREQSIELRCSGISVPPLNSPKMIAEGAEHYAAMCTGCHLAPDMRENEMRPGLNPEPPVLSALPPGDPREQFWIIDHGIRMTAMPAWGKSHSDEEIWKIVAFLQKLPGMTAGQYHSLTAKAAGHHEQDNMGMPR